MSQYTQEFSTKKSEIEKSILKQGNSYEIGESNTISHSRNQNSVDQDSNTHNHSGGGRFLKESFDDRRHLRDSRQESARSDRFTDYHSDSRDGYSRFVRRGATERYERDRSRDRGRDNYGASSRRTREDSSDRRRESRIDNGRRSYRSSEGFHDSRVHRDSRDQLNQCRSESQKNHTGYSNGDVKNTTSEGDANVLAAAALEALMSGDLEKYEDLNDKVIRSQISGGLYQSDSHNVTANHTDDLADKKGKSRFIDPSKFIRDVDDLPAWGDEECQKETDVKSNIRTNSNYNKQKQRFNKNEGNLYRKMPADGSSTASKCFSCNLNISEVAWESSYVKLRVLPVNSSITKFQCEIVPSEHISSSSLAPAVVRDEIRNLQKIIAVFFSEKGLIPVFVENSTKIPSDEMDLLMGKGGHFKIEVLPIPFTQLDEARIFFRKAFDDIGSDFDDNKKILSFPAGREGVRGVIPSKFPFISVDFTLQGGLVRVVEKSDLKFGTQVLASILNISEYDRAFDSITEWEKHFKEFSKFLSESL